MKIGSKLAIVLLAIVALAHLLRLLTQAEITVNGTTIPQWASLAGVLVPGTIAWLLWRGRR